MAPFSPTDVIEEYTRPARVMIEGREVIIPALSDRHEISVPGHGEMEAFLTDGLRSLTTSIPCSEMAEYTVRWPWPYSMLPRTHRKWTIGSSEVDRGMEV